MGICCTRFKKSPIVSRVSKQFHTATHWSHLPLPADELEFEEYTRPARRSVNGHKDCTHLLCPRRKDSGSDDLCMTRRQAHLQIHCAWHLDGQHTLIFKAPKDQLPDISLLSSVDGESATAGFRLQVGKQKSAASGEADGEQNREQHREGGAYPSILRMQHPRTRPPFSAALFLRRPTTM